MNFRKMLRYDKTPIASLEARTILLKRKEWMGLKVLSGLDKARKKLISFKTQRTKYSATKTKKKLLKLKIAKLRKKTKALLSR